MRVAAFITSNLGIATPHGLPSAESDKIATYVILPGVFKPITISRIIYTNYKCNELYRMI